MLNQPRHYSAKGEIAVVRRREALSYADAYGVLEQYRREGGTINRMDIPDPEQLTILLKLQNDVRAAIRDYHYARL